MSKKKPDEYRPFNPLDKKHLGESVAKALLESQVHPLPPKKFKGAGIYVIYYTGDFKPYQRLAKKNPGDKFELPIYVGKAVPKGARKGGFGLDEDPKGVLYKRLNEHYKSVQAAKNLNADDFCCRYLVVEDIWIPLAESLLIEKFHPVWNHVLDGFGNHAPGKGRKDQKRSRWDEVHPGRDWAKKLEPCEVSKDDLIQEVEDALAD